MQERHGNFSEFHSGYPRKPHCKAIYLLADVCMAYLRYSPTPILTVPSHGDLRSAAGGNRNPREQKKATKKEEQHPSFALNVLLLDIQLFA